MMTAPSTRQDRSQTNMASALSQGEYKVIIIGALGVGKTSILLQYINNSFEDRMSKFISEEKKTVVVDGKEIVLDLWDTAGQERFQSITNRFYNDAHAVVIVYDITQIDSFHDIDFWVREIQYYLTQELEDGLPVLFVGNKKDLVDKDDMDQQIVKFRQIHEVANAYGFLRPVECSAKTGEGVKKVFHTIASHLVKSKISAKPVIIQPTPKKCACTGSTQSTKSSTSSSDTSN